MTEAQTLSEIGSPASGSLILKRILDALASGLGLVLLLPLLACVAVQATAAVKWRNGPWIQDDGYEYLLVLAALGIGFAFTGGGPLSLDDALGTGFAGVAAGIVAVAAAALTPLLPRRVGAAGGP